jgi:threonine dehydrogenase-like Zn-dependent dehydrogenase
LLSISADWFFIGAQLQLLGIAATPLRYFPALIERTTVYDLPFARLITHHSPLEQAQEAFAVMESGRSGKVIFDARKPFERSHSERNRK